MTEGAGGPGVTVLRERLHWWHHPEALVCGFRGHVVPVGSYRRVTPGWAHLEATTLDGRRLGRCLRCGAWLAAPSEGAPDAELTELRARDIPRHGRELRAAIVLRAIAVERAVHAVIFALAAIGLAVLRLDLPGLQASARRLTQGTTNTLAGPGQTASRDVLLRELTRVLNLRRGTLGVLAVSALVYCLVEGTEGVGLWFERRWAEYLTALATAGFLPFEIDELVKRVTVLKLSALVVNLAVLIYLVWRKHLFGIGRPDPPVDRVAEISAWAVSGGPD